LDFNETGFDIFLTKDSEKFSFILLNSLSFPRKKDDNEVVSAMQLHMPLLQTQRYHVVFPKMHDLLLFSTKASVKGQHIIQLRSEYTKVFTFIDDDGRRRTGRP
jgi:hypothetical protein